MGEAKRRQPRTSAAPLHAKSDPAVLESRTWPHDEPHGWNLDAAAFVARVQRCPHMWLELMRAKYLEIRIDTRDGGFSLYDRDGKFLSPDEVIGAIERTEARLGSDMPYREIERG